MTNVDSLKALYVGLGGEAEAVADANDSVEVLNAIAKKYGGEEAETNAEAVANIAAVADNIGTKIERVFIWDCYYHFEYDMQEVTLSIASYDDLHRYDGLTAVIQCDDQTYETVAHYYANTDSLGFGDAVGEFPMWFFVHHGYIYAGSVHSGEHRFGVKVVDNKVSGRQVLDTYETTYNVSLFATARIAEPVTNAASLNFHAGDAAAGFVSNATMLGPYLEQNVLSYETSYFTGYFDRKLLSGGDVCVNVCTFTISGEVTALQVASYTQDYAPSSEAFASFKYNETSDKTYCSISLVLHNAFQGNWGANIDVTVTMAGGDAQ